MKQLRYFLCLALISALFACSDDDSASNESARPDQISPPQHLTASVTPESATVSWDAVAEAKCYSYTLDESEEVYTTATSVTFDPLAPQSSHTFRVKAVSGDLSKRTDSDWAQCTFTTTEKPVPVFEISIDKVTFSNVEVTVTPADPTMTYFCNIIPKSDYDSFGSPEQLMQQQVALIAQLAEANEYTFEAYCKAMQLIHSGVNRFEADKLIPDTDYVEFVFGLSYNAEITTGIVTESLHTEQEPKVKPSDMTFTFEMKDVTDISASVQITPSRDDEWYFCFFVEKGNLSALGDAGVIDVCLEDLNEHISSSDYETVIPEQCHKGAFLYSYGELEPNHEYVGFAFGVGKQGLNAAASTRLFKTEPFMTRDKEQSDDPIRIEVINFGITGTEIKFIPTPEASPFRCELTTLDTFAGMSDEEILKKDMENLWKDSGEYYVWSLCTGDFTLTRINELKPDTDYIAYAYGLSESKFEATSRLCKKILHTPAANPASAALRRLVKR